MIEIILNMNADELRDYDNVVNNEQFWLNPKPSGRSSGHCYCGAKLGGGN